MNVVILFFERITALDAIGPYEVLSRLPGARVTFAGLEVGPVRTDNRMLGLHVDQPIDAIASADILLVPGGHGTRALCEDERVLAWIKKIHATTTWTTSVCTGSLVLGAAGLLKGKRATTHWALLDGLAKYDAQPVSERVVQDGKVVTAAGVSAGIDMALTLMASIAGEDFARAIQLGIEYDPAPPFEGGSVDNTPPGIVELVRAQITR
ncbi:MAG: DJ-1/PfpI family protein [Sandaracinaceae bacterium]